MMHSSLANLQELPIVTEAGAARAERSDADALLVVRLRAGDVDAFDLLVERYQLPLFRFLRGLVGSPEQAEDLLQETFLRAFRAIGSLDDPGLLRGWLYRIAHNLALSALRRRRLISWLPLQPGRPLGVVSHDRTAIEAAEVSAALARVPLDQRAPLLLHLVAGFSYAEVAVLLGVSEGTVRMRISRGRAAFRAAYRAGENDDAP
ncbi:MAG: RNA polymerase sigma factor [Chloroflexi bacterium SZAS-1]|nr:RNA polymerase sigma factor [Chloroflexi bacterium SZAS-1]